ncbi:hypothetical protein [Nocardia sp. SYP-A9097]|uniref:hypothetical protein n=1 Tax=Nocardia sp. SYP-A9097 TaxID=2663237 RepID=UPI0028157053|nr:hypothetical protein [Nocardia sp. SYP-A9097]
MARGGGAAAATLLRRDSSRVRAADRRAGAARPVHALARAVPPDVDFDAAAWMLVRAVEHLTIRYLLEDPPIPRDRFLTDITRLVLNYFRDPRPRAERE